MILHLLTKLLVGERLDAMPMHKIVEMGERGELTFREMKRLTKLQRYAAGLSR